MPTVFMNVDTQFDFIDPAGRLAIPGATEILPNLARLTQFAHQNDIPIINTADWHTIRDFELSNKPDFTTTFPPHCLEMTRGAMFVLETAPKDPVVLYYNSPPLDDFVYQQRGDVVILKNKFNVFQGNPYTGDFFRRCPPFLRIVVYGVATNVCVDQAIKGLIEFRDEISANHTRPIFTVEAVHDATKGINCEEGKVFAEWFDLGAVIVSTDDILKIVANNP